MTQSNTETLKNIFLHYNTPFFKINLIQVQFDETLN
jgi:hypothetical protein